MRCPNGLTIAVTLPAPFRSICVMLPSPSVTLRSVPAGEYAQQTLEHLKLTEKLKTRLIFGLNVRQVEQWARRGRDILAGFSEDATYNAP